MKEERTSMPETEARMAAPSAAASAPEASRTIVVNGRSLRFEGETIDRQQVARIAYPTIDAAAERSLTVAYNGSASGGPAGLLAAGQTTEVVNGQTFNVSLTDKS